MKKYIFTMLAIGVILGGILIYNTIKINDEEKIDFYSSGYILESNSASEVEVKPEEGTEATQNTQGVSRYYFSENTTYKEKYNEKAIFKDTEGESVKVNLDNFVHYTNGSISSLKNGVILNLDEIEDDPITYYNIKKGSVLVKKQDKYTIKNLEKELSFDKIIWKISPQKYIILANPLTLVFNDGTTKEINGYVEIEYLDNEIIKIYNQEATYQTISSNSSIEIGDIKINLSSKIISKANENKMSLENMVIDSDDNVTIVDLTQEEEKEENTQSTDSTESTDNNAGNTSSTNNNQTTNNTEQTNNNTNSTESTTNQDNDNVVIDDNTTESTDNPNDDSNITDDDSNITDDDFEEETIVEPPTMKVEKLEVNSIRVDATITISDENSLLTGDTIVRIQKNSTGKIVYEIAEPLGNYNIDISTSVLEPNTEYSLIVEAPYQIDEMNYTKNFISKIFRTTSLGISLEKDIITNDSLQVLVNKSKSGNVKKLTVQLLDQNDSELQSQDIEFLSTVTEDQSQVVNFMGLTSNTTYKVKVTDIQYESQIITSGADIIQTYKTLKEKPEINGTEFEINKRDGNFKLRLKNVVDPDSSIQKYRFEIFDTRTIEVDEEGNLIFQEASPVTTIETTDRELTLKIDDVTIFRKIGYAFRVVAIGNDNEKEVECASEYSNVFKMDGEEFPTVRFEQTEVTFERIIGNIIVEDKGQTIQLTDDTLFTVTYQDSVGTIRTFTSQGSYTIPVDVNNLRANETYQFSVYTTVDLNDGNGPIEQCYIGGILIKTAEPNNLVANFTKNGQDVKKTFSVSLELGKETETQSDLELDTLTEMEISIYSGQVDENNLPTGTLLRTIKVVDNNLDEYESEIKDKYYKKKVEITPEFFNAQNNDFTEKFYTIVVRNAVDYTDYKNALPILNNAIQITTNGTIPDLPSDVNNALNVTVIRNRDAENVRDDLNSSTIVGYNVRALYDNTDLYAKTIIYKAFNAETNELIKTIEVPVGVDGVIPEATFDVLDGTDINTKDTDELRRGNKYYFTYEAMLDLNKDGEAETKYPFEEEEVELKSKTQAPEKQEPQIIMYHSTSATSTMTFKYTCKDVDNAITGDNLFYAKIGSTIVSRMPIEKSATYKEVTFTGLSKGTLEIYINYNIMKTDLTQEKRLINHKFDAKNYIDQVKYKVSLDSTKVLIELIDSNSQLNNIASVKVILSEVGGDTKVEKDFTSIPSSNIVAINLNDLGELLKKQTQVQVIAYYNTGTSGFDFEDGHYVVLKKANITDNIEYYTINSSNRLVEGTSLRDNMFDLTLTDNQLQLVNPSNNKNITTEVVYTENGIKYQGNVIIPQQVNTEELECEGSNTISFDLIIPGISLQDTSGNWTIQTELDNASFTADLLIDKDTTIVDDTIYVDIYETDQNGIKEDFVKTLTLKVSDFSQKITISDLTPKTYYFMKFRTQIQLAPEEITDKDLYDIDFQVSGRAYYFTTLADVGISDIKVTYEPKSYEEKYINIEYSLERITGYTRIEYELYHYNKLTQEYEPYGTINPDQIFEKNMQKKVAINPGSNFIFGDKYKIVIKPLVEYVPLDSPDEMQLLELGTKEQEFTFDKLTSPIIALNGSRQDDKKILFRVTVYDYDKVISGNKYKIKIVDEEYNDVTPEQYKDKEFDVNTLNQQIELENASDSKSYTLQVTTSLDLENTNNPEKFQTYLKDYTVYEINEFGISVGTITPAQNGNKVELIFNNSYKLTDINTIKYSIYNTNGYAINGEEPFVPKQFVIDGGDSVNEYYTYVLNTEFDKAGIYVIEMQFIKAGIVVVEETVEYVYEED